MGDPSRDPLAEHPLSPEAGRRSGRAPRPLELFPELGDAPLQPEPAAPSNPASGPSEMGGSLESSPRARSEPEEAAEALLELAPGPSRPPGSVAFARRLAAGLADIVIIALVGAIEVAAGASLLGLQFPAAAFIGLSAFLFLAALVLMVLAPFVWGTTPGMALADLKVRADDGGSPTLAAAFLRFIGFLLTGLLAGVPLLIAAFDRQGRTLADLISRTTLVPADAPLGSKTGGVAA